MAQETVLHSEGALQPERVTTYTLDPDGTGLYHNDLELVATVQGGETYVTGLTLKSGHTNDNLWGIDDIEWTGPDSATLNFYLADQEVRDWGFEYRAIFATKTPSCWFFSNAPSKTGGQYEHLIIIVKLPEGATLISADPVPDDTYMEGSRPCIKYDKEDSAGVGTITINYSTRACGVPEFDISAALVSSVAFLLLLPLKKKFHVRS